MLNALTDNIPEAVPKTVGQSTSAWDFCQDRKACACNTFIWRDSIKSGPNPRPEKAPDRSPNSTSKSAHQAEKRTSAFGKNHAATKGCDIGLDAVAQFARSYNCRSCSASSMRFCAQARNIKKRGSCEPRFIVDLVSTHLPESSLVPLCAD